MNLTNASELVKRHLPSLLFFVIVSNLVALIYLRYIKEPAEEPPLLPDIQVSDLPVTVQEYNSKNLQITGTYPKTVDVYEHSSENSFLERVDEIISQFKAQGDQKETADSQHGTGIFMQGTNGTLLIYHDYVSFNSISSEPGSLSEFNAQDMNNVARNYLSTFTITNQSLDESEIAYYHTVGEDFYLDSDPNGASLAKLDFPQKIDNLRLINPAGVTSVTFNKKGQITKTSFALQKNVALLGKYQIISFKKALERLEAGEGKVISANSMGSILISKPQYRTIKSIILKNAGLAYYDPLGGNSIQPVWVFEGEGTINNQAITATIIIPAIQYVSFETTPT